jgi:hypothetical protein
MPRDRSGEPLLGVRLSRSFAGTVERVAASQGLSKSDFTRRALIAAVLPPDGDDA